MSADTLFGALRGIEAEAACVCGCKAFRHTPCCGSCLDCADVVCGEFEAAAPTGGEG